VSELDRTAIRSHLGLPLEPPECAVFEELGRQLGEFGERVSHLELAVARLWRGPLGVCLLWGFRCGFRGWRGVLLRWGFGFWL
jgi:hypothetical protein